MPHVMVDIETLGTRPGDCILSIGAVVFDPTRTEGDFESVFYETINMQESWCAGFTSTKSTVEWWAKQSPQARAAAFAGEATPKNALQAFANWVPKDSMVWGNGANFDNTLLSAAFRLCNVRQPWEFWNDRCYRTMKAQYQDVPVQRVGVYHNALDDAKTQARHLQRIVAKHNITLG